MKLRILLPLAMACMAAAAPPAAEMAPIPAGTYRPLFAPAGKQPAPIAVAAFRIDRRPVTNGDFLRFVREHREWSRDRIDPLFAEQGYLTHWASADAHGDAPGSDAGRE